jgi:hypothetical protein
MKDKNLKFSIALASLIVISVLAFTIPSIAVAQGEEDLPPRNQTIPLRLISEVEIVAIENVDQQRIFVYDYDGQQHDRNTPFAENWFVKRDDDWAHLALGDVDGDGMDEIVAIETTDQNRIFVYDYDGQQHPEDTFANTYFVKRDPNDPWAHLALGDVDGDSLRVGPPIHTVQTIEDQVLAIINAPPKHTGVNNERDIFFAAYKNIQGEETSHSVKAKADWSFTYKMKLEAGESKIGKMEITFQQKIGQKFEREVGERYTTRIGLGFTADTRDRVIIVDTTYDVYEYPIISPPDLAVVDGEQQYIVIMIPQGAPVTDEDHYDSPIHEEGDIRTYPSNPNDLINYDESNLIHETRLLLGPDESWRSIGLSEATREREMESTFARLSLSAGYESSFGLVSAGFSLTGDYGAEVINTHEIKFTEDTNILVKYEGGIEEESKEYRVGIVAYYDSENGHLVVDYVVPEVGSYYADPTYDTIELAPGTLSMVPVGGSTLLIVEDGRMPPESTIQIPISIENADDIGNMDIMLTYDPEVLSATEVIKGSLTDGSMFESNIIDGTVRIGFVDTVGINGNGSIAQIGFDVVGSPGDSSVLTLTASANEIETREEVHIALRHGLFIVEAVEEMKGDCDGDGDVDSVDALLALKMSVGKIEVNLIGDMNDDGQVTSFDAAEIMRIGTRDAVIETNYDLLGYSTGPKPHNIIGAAESIEERGLIDPQPTP